MTFGILGSGFRPTGLLSPEIARLGRPEVLPATATTPASLPNPGMAVTPQQAILGQLLGGGGGFGLSGGRQPGERGDFARRRGPAPIGSERLDIGFPSSAALGLLLGGPIGGLAGFARDVATAPVTRSLTSRQARDIQRRARDSDRRANRDLREGRGSGASPRRGDVSNAGR